MSTFLLYCAHQGKNLEHCNTRSDRVVHDQSMPLVTGQKQGLSLSFFVSAELWVSDSFNSTNIKYMFRPRKYPKNFSVSMAEAAACACEIERRLVSAVQKCPRPGGMKHCDSLHCRYTVATPLHSSFSLVIGGCHWPFGECEFCGENGEPSVCKEKRSRHHP